MTGYQVNISKNKTLYTTFKETMTLETMAFKETVNFGIRGERSQHALCRAMNGEIQLSARCIAVNVGNNNIDRDPPSKIADDTIAIGQKFHEALPKVKVMLVGLSRYCHATKDTPSVATASRKSTPTSGTIASTRTQRGFTTCPQTSSLHQRQMAI